MELTFAASLFGTTGLLGFALLVWSCCRWPLWGVALFVGVRTWEALNPGTGGMFGTGVDLMAADAVAAVLLCAAAVRLTAEGRLRVPAPVAL
ncbi:hypothetical protein P8605_35405, partial [Streptomyces sp. T-3]|nr:hypothetical protein [Streptomyces sp. T-3]